jgi:hypothetical protein
VGLYVYGWGDTVAPWWLKIYIEMLKISKTNVFEEQISMKEKKKSFGIFFTIFFFPKWNLQI